jgi:hypothetical protein
VSRRALRWLARKSLIPRSAGGVVLRVLVVFWLAGRVVHGLRRPGPHLLAQMLPVIIFGGVVTTAGAVLILVLSTRTVRSWEGAPPAPPRPLLRAAVALGDAIRAAARHLPAPSQSAPPLPPVPPVPPAPAPAAQPQPDEVLAPPA